MKKLLLIALLLLALTITAVACTGGDDETESATESATESVSESVSETDSDTESVSETESATDSETSTETESNTDTETPTETEAPTETETETEAPETLPAQPEAGCATQVKPSWDSIYKNTEGELAPSHDGTDGAAADRFTANPFKLDDTWTTLYVRGWAGSGDSENAIVKFGYRIDLGEMVIDADGYRELNLPTEQPVVDAGGDARYCIAIPTEALKGGFHYIRAYGICADGTAVEILNMWIEGRDLTPLEAAQAWDIDKSVVTHLSFDDLRKNDGPDGYFTPGALATDPNAWDGIADVVSLTHLNFWGWIGIAADTVGQFGYAIDDAAPIFDDAWTHATGEDVINAALTTGAATASRMLITIPVEGLMGDHTVTVYYKAADDSAYAILRQFTVKGIAILSGDEAGLVKLQIDSENSDNYSASIAGWLGFGDKPMAALGWSVDGGAITWNGSLYDPAEAELGTIQQLAGSAAKRYGIQASFDGLPFGEHEIVYYAKLEDGTICQIHTQSATNTDPSQVGNSTANFNSAESADLLGFFKNDGGAPGACNYTDNTTSYKLAGITSIHATMDGTYELTVTNLTCGNAGQAVVFFRGNPNPTFGDSGYFGHDNLGNESVGCAGVYVSIIDGNLRLNVKGQDAEGKAVLHVYTVAMTGKDLKVVDDNASLKFYEGDTLLATVALTGNNGGYATQAVVTLADGTTETLDDVCAAATAASDIGFIARSVDLTFDAVTVKGLAE